MWNTMAMTYTIFSTILFRPSRQVFAFTKTATFARRAFATSLSSTSPSASTFPEKSSSRTGIPMTILSGFLGSGKTTALQHLLQNKVGMKIGVVVNDVANINIDAKLIANDTKTSVGDDIIELQNGCACCSLADELLTSIDTLTTNRDFDAIVVELSGVADPYAVKYNWQDAESLGHPATQRVNLNKVVTVVDACTFGTDWMSWNKVGERDGWVGAPTPGECNSVADRKVPELLAEQVEAADVLLINKLDSAGAVQVETAFSVARALNKKASLFPVSFGKVDPSEMLDLMQDKKEDKAKTNENLELSQETNNMNDHGHDHSHDHSHDKPDDLGIVSLVYKAKRPFHPLRLTEVFHNWPIPIKEDLDLQQLAKDSEKGIRLQVDGKLNKNPFIGVLRSKGFSWVAPVSWTGQGKDVWRHDTAFFWSHAGKHFNMESAGKWWGSISKEKMKSMFISNQKEYERILREDWVTEEFGDRRQEIVFIGTNINQEEIYKSLDDCLLTDNELDDYRQQLQNFQYSILSVEATADGGPSLLNTNGSTVHTEVGESK